MKNDIFLFGTLRHDALRALVLGGQPPMRAAVLPDFAQFNCAGYPVLMPQIGAQADGGLVALDAASLARLDFYESLFEYQREQIVVFCDGHPVQAQVYRPKQAPPNLEQYWSLDDWCDRHGDSAMIATQEVFALSAIYAPEVLKIRYPMLLAHAASQIRAGQSAQPATLRGSWGRGDVVSRQRMQPYAYFFGVQVDDLSFRRFDGSESEVVRRAAFVMSDAVTLLPYDPKLDLVMVIEQFRYGPYIRGDANCWSLEPIAGRIDPGESAEDCALREAQEEAQLGLTKAALVPVGASYPSPGAISEYLYSFIGLCDLSHEDEGVSGLASEAENIRSHVIPFDRLMALIDSAEVRNGPLIQTAYWLALNRARLQTV